jgi:hypothetical protein
VQYPSPNKGRKMTPRFNIGDTVFTNLEHAWIYEGTEREGLMSKRRRGVVVDMTEHCKREGSGLLLVRWESLTAVPLKRSDWWTHSDVIEAQK